MPSRSAMRLQWAIHRRVWSISGGRIGSRVVGMPVLELVTIGHRSHQPRTVLLTYIDDPNGPVVFGTNGGLDNDPAWVSNLRATPAVRVRIRRRWTEAVAVEVVDELQRNALWSAAVAANKGYDDYLRTLTRTVPIIRLVPST